MTVVNATGASQAINISLVSGQFAFAGQDPQGPNDATRYSFLTSDGTDVVATGAGMDFANDPPAFGTATQIDFDLTNNNVNDVTMSAITGLTGNGAVAAARMTEVTSSAIDFANEVMSFNDTVTGSAFDDLVICIGADYDIPASSRTEWQCNELSSDDRLTGWDSTRELERVQEFVIANDIISG